MTLKRWSQTFSTEVVENIITMKFKENWVGDNGKNIQFLPIEKLKEWGISTFWHGSTWVKNV